MGKRGGHTQLTDDDVAGTDTGDGLAPVTTEASQPAWPARNARQLRPIPTRQRPSLPVVQLPAPPAIVCELSDSDEFRTNIYRQHSPSLAPRRVSSHPVQKF